MCCFLEHLDGILSPLFHLLGDLFSWIESSLFAVTGHYETVVRVENPLIQKLVFHASTPASWHWLTFQIVN